MKQEKGNFVYDEQGKIVWQSSEDGKWMVSNQNSSPDNTKCKSEGIDLYREYSTAERLKIAKALQNLGNTSLDKRIYKKKK